MSSHVDTGTIKGLRLLVERLRTRHKRHSVVAVLLCLLSAGSEGIGILLLIPLLASVGISTGESTRWADVPGFDPLGLGTNIYGILVLFLGLLALRQFIVYQQRIELSRVGLDFSHAVRAELFAALTAAEWRHFAAGTLHRHAQILTHEANGAGGAAQQCLTLVSSVFLCVVQIGVAAWLSTMFTVAAIAGLGVFAILFRKHVAQMAHMGKQLIENNRSLYSITLNLLPLLRTAKMAGNTPELVERFRTSSWEINRTLRRHVRNQSVSAVTIQLIAAIALVVALVVGVELVGLDALSASVLILIFARLTPQLTQVQQIALQLIHTLPAMAITLDSIAQWQGRAEASNTAPLQLLLPPRSVIELRNVSGGYVDDGNGPFVRDVTLRIPMGSLMLATGPTGSGKSTLADIAAGLLRPTAGAIVLDGCALSYDRLAQWRTRVGYVEQAATLFTGSVKENLLWGLQDVDGAWLERILWASTVDDFIDSVPGGMEGSVGEGGAKLSGGQRQRLAVARELLRSPSLLVLDEATSGLDQATEAKMLERILGLGDGLAVLLVSHRPTARKFANQVVELEHGRVKSLSPGGAAFDHRSTIAAKPR